MTRELRKVRFADPLVQPKPVVAIKPFRFLDLPPELRNRVYGFLFKVSPTYRRHKEVFFVKGSALPDDEDDTVLAILETCRQIHEEALGIFYTTNDFAIRTSDLVSFVRATGATRLQSIVNLKIHLSTYDLSIPTVFDELKGLRGLKGLTMYVQTRHTLATWRSAKVLKGFRALVNNAPFLETITVDGPAWGRRSTKGKVQALLQGVIDGARAGR